MYKTHFIFFEFAFFKNMSINKFIMLEKIIKK